MAINFRTITLKLFIASLQNRNPILSRIKRWLGLYFESICAYLIRQQPLDLRWFPYDNLELETSSHLHEIETTYTFNIIKSHLAIGLVSFLNCRLYIMKTNLGLCLSQSAHIKSGSILLIGQQFQIITLKLFDWIFAN